jgi:endonuclease YncB( thermonuclease family)
MLRRMSSMGEGRRSPGWRQPAGHAALAAVAVLTVLLAGLLAGCGPDSPPRLATSAAERATWPKAPANAVAARVERVVDGDTFVAELGGRDERVRVIGVDTPETVAPGRPVERYGKEASSFAKRELSGVTVRLGGDVEPRDRYDRLLAYVWLPDGTFWNALLAAEGYAQLITVPPNVAYVDLFRRLVAEARAAHRGLWAGEPR